MQKYLILINLENKATGFVPVPDWYEVKESFRIGAAIYGYTALAGHLTFQPADSELRDGRQILEALIALDQPEAPHWGDTVTEWSDTF